MTNFTEIDLQKCPVTRNLRKKSNCLIAEACLRFYLNLVLEYHIPVSYGVFRWNIQNDRQSGYPINNPKIAKNTQE